MLYLFYGTDKDKARNKVQATVASLLKRTPDASYVRLDDETFTDDALNEYISEQGLFAGRVLVVLDHVAGDKEKRAIVAKQAKAMADSENIFIALDEKLDATTLTKLKKYAEKVAEFSPKTKAKKEHADFNVFKLTDALGARDSKKLWVLYQQALRAGVVPEEIHGLLFWQTKTMLLVAQKSTKGLKPFVVSKAKRFLANWVDEQLVALSSNLIETYHDARRGKFELEVGLEQLILSL